MKRNSTMNLEAAWKILFSTGNWQPFVKAYKAVYGTYPVYIPQH